MKANLYALGTIALWSTLATLGVSLSHVPPFLLTGLALLLGSVIALPLSGFDLRQWRVPASTLALGALTPVPSYAEGVRLLKAGQIDTLVADELLIPKDAAIALRPEQLTVEPCALVMRKGDAAFVDAVDKALHKILGGAQGKQLAQDSGLKVDHLTRDAWQSPNKQPAPPVL